MLADLPGTSVHAKRQAFLSHVSRLLAYESKRMSTYGLPEPKDTPNELEIVRDLQREQDPNRELVQLLSSGLNAEQQQVFDMVQDAYRSGRRLLLFVQVRCKTLIVRVTVTRTQRMQRPRKWARKRENECLNPRTHNNDCTHAISHV